MADHELLELLNVHCSQELGHLSHETHPEKRRRLDSTMDGDQLRCQNASAASEDESDEWHGLEHSQSLGEEEEDSDEGHEDQLMSDDEFRADSTFREPSKVVVFSESKLSGNASQNKAQMKAFMSSKIAKQRVDEREASSLNKKTAKEEEEERTNMQNDAILHRLVHTKLLSGSLDPSLEMKPADRRKALQGRVLELASSAKLGKGDKAIRNAERNKASKRVREGLLAKQKYVHELRKEEAKNLGNYHPSLKRLYDEDEEKGSRPKRERGIAMGVGKFSGGILQLSSRDVQKVTGNGSRNKGNGRGRSKGRR